MKGRNRLDGKKERRLDEHVTNMTKYVEMRLKEETC